MNLILLGDATGSMSDVITALLTGINASTIFSVVAQLVPFIVMIVPVALGLYFLRKLVKGSGKGKIKFQPNRACLCLVTETGF